MSRRRYFRVKRVKVCAGHTLISLTGGHLVQLSPYVYLRRGDLLEFHPNCKSFRTIHKIFRDRATGEQARVLVYPPYEQVEEIHVPPHRFRITFKERVTRQEWKAAKALEQFHYRGKGFNLLVGRRVALLAQYPPFGIVAYGVLSATVAAAKPRFKLFSTNFTQQMRTGLINQIARIPRIVVHPEFRGMGLGVLMARHLIRYAKRYWDIKAYKPIMIEVIAAMTEYHRFFERAGFVRLGYTLGYGEGILPQYGNGAFEKRNFKRFEFMRNQKAKPYLIYPLTMQVRKRMSSVFRIDRRRVALVAMRQPRGTRLVLENACVAYRVRNGNTVRANVIREAFGVDKAQIASTVLRALNIVIEPGEVVLVTGASGCGKSTLLRLISKPRQELRREMHLRGRVQGVRRNEIAVLSTDFESTQPLIEQICVGEDVSRAIELLNSVGLAEAYLYLKAPNQMSDGQRYRFAVARLCDSGRPVWVADEFAATLNPEMAALVAKGLRRVARSCGATVVLAAADAHAFAESLLPNRLVRLSWGGEAKVFSVSAKWEEAARAIWFELINESDQELTNCAFDVMSVRGDLVRVRTRRSLAAGASWRGSVLKSKLTQAMALRVRCAEGIGDIVYLQTVRQLG